jgi:hypothetical protein
MALLRGLLAVVAGIAAFSGALLAMMAAGNALLGAEPEWINAALEAAPGSASSTAT